MITENLVYQNNDERKDSGGGGGMADSDEAGALL